MGDRHLRRFLFNHSECSQLQLNTALEKLREPDEAEPIQAADAVGELEPDVVGEVPVEHRRVPPELAAGQRTAVEIDVGEVVHELNGAAAALKNRARRRNLIEDAGSLFIWPDLSGDQPRGKYVAAVENRVARLRCVLPLNKV